MYFIILAICCFVGAIRGEEDVTAEKSNFMSRRYDSMRRRNNNYDRDYDRDEDRDYGRDYRRDSGRDYDRDYDDDKFNSFSFSSGSGEEIVPSGADYTTASVNFQRSFSRDGESRIQRWSRERRERREYRRARRVDRRRESRLRRRNRRYSRRNRDGRRGSREDRRDFERYDKTA